MKRLISLLTLAAATMLGQTLINGPRVVAGGINYCEDAGSTDAYACALSPAITAYATGAQYTFKAATANTGGATLALCGLTATAIVKYVGGTAQALADNDIRAGAVVTVVYDGTNFQLVSALGNGGSGGGDTTSVANSGSSGAAVLKTGTNVTARKLKEGTNVTITENTDDITIAASGGSSYDPTDATQFSLVEDFASFDNIAGNHGIGNHSWWIKTYAGSGHGKEDVAQASDGSDKDHPGVIRIFTVATSGTGFSFAPMMYDKEARYILPSATGWKGCAVFALETLTNVSLWIGPAREGATVQPNNFVGLYYTAAGSAGNWQYGARRYYNSSYTYSDSEIAATTGWHKFCAWSDANTTSKVYVQLDANTQKSICAAGCDITGSIVAEYGTGWDFRLTNTANENKSLLIDWLGLKATVTR